MEYVRAFHCQLGRQSPLSLAHELHGHSAKQTRGHMLVSHLYSV